MAKSKSPDLHDIERELAAAPRADFVEARGKLVEQLRANGDRELAAQAATVRKPSVTTWAVNAATRTAPDTATRFVETVRTLQSPGELDVRATTAELDDHLDDLVAAAKVALREACEATNADRLAQVRTALRSTALADPEALLESRVADVEANPDSTLEAALLAGAHGRARPSSAPSAAAPTADDAHERLAQLRRQRDEAKAVRTDARNTLRDAERQVRRLQRELDDASAARDEAADAADAADERLRRLTDAVDAAGSGS